MAMTADNQAITNARDAICTAGEGTGYSGLAKEFKDAGETFITELTTALSTFEGATKDALIEKKIGAVGSETEGTLAYFVSTQIPDLIKGLSSLLEGNRSTIEESDRKLAEAISGNGEGQG
ncbi:MAG: hypothetical protein K2N49_05430 [Ruminococcus sp.]|nr:hypothetical protein [Ruminococcus sp.]MDE7226283.1 hypothetical protein [Ruminococcus sp.]